MNDDIESSDTPSDELQAVSAALDGTATVDERALIDASPELGQLLAELEGARHSMIDVQVPSQAREAGIAAALAAFDDQHNAPIAAVVAPSTPSNVVAFERKKRFYRSITAAAAAVVVLVVGIAALGSLGGGEDNDEMSTAAVDVTDDMAATKIEAAPAETEAPAEADAPAPMIAADSTARADAGSAQTEDAAEQPATEETTAPAATDAAATSTIGEILVPGEITPIIPDEASLQAYAADAPTRDAGGPCIPVGDENLGDVSYQGTPAVVVRDPGTGEVRVYDTADCTVLATLPN